MDGFHPGGGVLFDEDAMARCKERFGRAENDVSISVIKYST